mmetsp:Transcript_3674/g.7020  ORF Transcript_3674/g.7020 Transcript_3674/m.7020 type:complete len:121 (-) Transcript_3674:249-611(-)
MGVFFSSSFVAVTQGEKLAQGEHMRWMIVSPQVSQLFGFVFGIMPSSAEVCSLLVAQQRNTRKFRRGIFTPDTQPARKKLVSPHSVCLTLLFFMHCHRPPPPWCVWWTVPIWETSPFLVQ